MLKQVTLTNFRRHENLVVNFEPGLNTVRGFNESGKSTLLQGILYGWFGSKALNESLADVVTWGKPKSTLKVEQVFTVGGTEYRLKRSDSGAELRFGEESVTGQTDVTKKIESIFGCSADTACKLLFAKQSQIQGALSEGASAPVKLIEVLSNFDLIDTIIELVEAHLPCGNTKLTEARVAQLKLDSAEVINTDLSSQESEVDSALLLVSKAKLEKAVAQETLDGLDVVSARATMTAHARLFDTVEATKADLETTKKAIGTIPPPKADTEKLPELREALDKQKTLKSVLSLKSKFDAAKFEMEWDEPLAKLQEAVTDTTKLVTETRDRINSNKLKLNTLQGQVISDTTCKLCQKDLKDVPEVVLINNRLYPQIKALEDAILEDNGALRDHSDFLSQLNDIAATNNKAEQLFASCGEHVTVDRSMVPGKAVWIGPSEADDTDYQSQIDAIEAADKAYIKASSAKKVNQERKEELQARLEKANSDIEVLPLEKAADTVRAYKAAEEQLTGATATYQKTLRDFDAATASISQAKAVLAELVKRIDVSKSALEKADKELSDMIKHNVLVKKLRNARPQIATKLWTIVLGSCSTYFSDMRGTPSVVTRDEDGFKVNGKAVAGLSGSTLDVLGLAIRVALTRTFLPNIPFMGLDEPASGCDDDRETAMLGLITACKFDQVLLVTHSSLADAFSSQVITLGGENA